MKVCCHCRRELDESCFSKKSSEKDGLRRECRDCMREYKKKYTTENREEYLRKRHEYDAKNSEKKKEYRKRNYEKYREDQIEYSRNYRIENREKYLESQRKSDAKRKGRKKEYNKEYAKKHREEISQKAKAYRNEHADHYRELERHYQKNRRSTDDMYKLKQDLRNLVGVSFRKNGWGKETKTQELIGCTFEEAKAHLEKTWFDNYGTAYAGEPVHIDHVVPVSTAKTPEELCALFHISNLQYLKPEDNMSKQDKLYWTLDGKSQMQFI